MDPKLLELEIESWPLDTKNFKLVETASGFSLTGYKTSDVLADFRFIKRTEGVFLRVDAYEPFRIHKVQHIERVSSEFLFDGKFDYFQAHSVMICAILTNQYFMPTVEMNMENCEWMKSMYKIIQNFMNDSVIDHFGDNLHNYLRSQIANNGVILLQKKYLVITEHAFNMAVQTVKQIFNEHGNKMTEEEVVFWFREANVEHILKS